MHYCEYYTVCSDLINMSTIPLFNFISKGLYSQITQIIIVQDIYLKFEHFWISKARPAPSSRVAVYVIIVSCKCWTSMSCTSIVHRLLCIDCCRLSFIRKQRSFRGQWMIAQMVERLLCTRRTRVQIPAPAPYEITL